MGITPVISILFRWGKEAFQIFWSCKFVYAFHSFALTGRVHQNKNQNQCFMLLVTPTCRGQGKESEFLQLTEVNILLVILNHINLCQHQLSIDSCNTVEIASSNDRHRHRSAKVTSKMLE